MKKECIVCGGEEFSLLHYTHVQNKIGRMHTHIYRFEKVFIEHRDERKLSSVSEITAKHCCRCGSYYVVSSNEPHQV